MRRKVKCGTHHNLKIRIIVGGGYFALGMVKRKVAKEIPLAVKRPDYYWDSGSVNFRHYAEALAEIFRSIKIRVNFKTLLG